MKRISVARFLPRNSLLSFTKDGITNEFWYILNDYIPKPLKKKNR